MRQKKKIYLAYNTLVKRSAEYICVIQAMDMAVKFRFWIRKRLDQCFGLFHLHILIKWFNCCLLAMISRFAKHFVHICIVNASVLRLPLHLIVKVNWLWGSKRSFYVLILERKRERAWRRLFHVVITKENSFQYQKGIKKIYVWYKVDPEYVSAKFIYASHIAS